MALRLLIARTISARPRLHISKRSLAISRRLFKDEEDMDKLQKNPYYDKYADKIAKLQK